MRRALITTVAATATLVLLAMLIPLAMLIGNYDLEDRLARAALEVQATETVVARHDRGMVSTYLERINSQPNGIVTTVLYPDGIGVGPRPGESAAVEEARTSGRARVDDTATGARILVPVSLGGASGSTPGETPVVRVDVESAPFPSKVHVAWAVLALLGITILLGALGLADRISLWFVRPITRLARDAGTLGGPDGAKQVEVSGPREVRELGHSLNRLVGRIETLLEREREANADLSHRLRTPVTALRLDIDALPEGPIKERLNEDIDRLHAMVDHLIHQARRSQREGVSTRVDAVATLRQRVEFWRPLAEDQGRSFSLALNAEHPVLVAASADDLEAAVDVLLDNVFSYTDPGTAISVSLAPTSTGLRLTIDDAGPGFDNEELSLRRGDSVAGSTGLGLSIAESTARATGGSLSLDRSPLGGARVVVELGRAD